MAFTYKHTQNAYYVYVYKPFPIYYILCDFSFVVNALCVLPSDSLPVPR